MAKEVAEEKPTEPAKEAPKQQDFEEQFTPEIVPASNSDSKNRTESKMSITSLAQGSGATVTIPSQVNRDVKKKSERFSLKTSIPISKIDMKCVNSEPVQAPKKPVFNPAFPKEVERPRVEIQSNIVIKSAAPDVENKEVPPVSQGNSISTLINAAEQINKNDAEFRIPEAKADIPKETKETPIPPVAPPPPVAIQRPIFNPMSIEPSKQNFPNKPPEGGFNEQKNQIVFIQNKTNANQKMMVTIQQQNPQVLLQRTNFESKNLQAPSRLSSQKKSKEEIVTDNSASKVVALKRLHQDDCDENDFENLITENQIYGNKIVVKEKSQGTQQEQDLKNKTKTEKQTQAEPKNVVLQPNFVYLSNVQFPNLMMVKNNKTCQTADINKPKLSPNENKTTEVVTIVNNNIIDANAPNKNLKPQIVVSKEYHVLKSSNNVLQTLTNNNNKTDVVFQNQKVLINPQIVYQMPVIIDNSDNKNQTVNKEQTNVTPQKKDPPKSTEVKTDKVLITCPYQVDQKMQPKIVITNLIPKMATKVEEISTLDIYERKKRLRRLKYLTNVKEQKAENKIKPNLKPESENKSEKPVVSKNVITPDKINAEICKEFAKTKECMVEDNSESDSDYGERDLEEYNTIIEEYTGDDVNKRKADFLAGFNLATPEVYKEKQYEREDRSLKFDSVATAYIAASDRLTAKEQKPEPVHQQMEMTDYLENRITMKRKQHFLSQLSLKQVTYQYREAYEDIWIEIIKDRNRRYGTSESTERRKPSPESFSNHLQLLTEIKNSVNENNNLIKRRLDSVCDENSDIRILAEKNFSELNRLSIMADRSVQLFSGQETRKRDLNPGFDSENIQKCQIEVVKDYPKLNIPDISSIISLKSAQEAVNVMSSPATSMDEPQKSAGGVPEVLKERASVGVQTTRDIGSQADDCLQWPGEEVFVRSYTEYELARKREINELHRRNTALRVECAHITRAASRDSDRARALLNERRHLSVEESNLRNSLHKLMRAIDIIRNS